MVKFKFLKVAATTGQDIITLLALGAGANVLSFTAESSIDITIDMGTLGTVGTYSNKLIGLDDLPYGVYVPQMVVSAAATVTINVRYEGGT